MERGDFESNDYYPFGWRHEVTDSDLSGNRFKYNGKELQTTGALGYLDYGVRMYDPKVGRWFGMDPLSEKYYSQSSYNYCGNSPVLFIDPNGEDVYMYFYVLSDKQKDNSMFWMGALTRAIDMLMDGEIGGGDIYTIRSISDFGMLGEAVDDVITEYSPRFGKTKEFGLWSHSALDGPVGGRKSSKGSIGHNQMSLDEWGNINYNWKNDGNARAMFFGCRTAADVNDAGDKVVPWVQSLSSYDNMKNVDVSGQIRRSWPSKLHDVGLTTEELHKDIHNYPIYMVGSSKGVFSRLQRVLGKANYAYPMAVYKNGKYLRTRYQ